MSASWLCVSMRFLDTTFHGRRDGGEPEWPPSPLRLLQALIATAGRLEPTGFSEVTTAALEWLERQPSPLIVAPSASTTVGRRLSVPNNAMDVVARAWSRGNDSDKGDSDPRTHRTMKTVRPMWLHGDRISFIWALPADSVEIAGHVEQLTWLARRVSALGWGVDLVVGDARVLNDSQLAVVEGERWSSRGSNPDRGIRVPVQGSLSELVARHEAFTKRIGTDGFTAPPPISRYEVVDYRRETDPATRPFVVLSLLRIDVEGFRAFDPVRKGLTVAGMTRHAAKVAAQSSGWDESKVARCVLGHGEERGWAHVASGTQRFAYLPLPSVEPRGERGRVVGRIRRVMVTTFGESMNEEIAWAKQSLAAQELVDERTGEPAALLSLLPSGDAVTRDYTRKASTWISVTPVVLPGFDDPNHLRRKMVKGVTAHQKKELIEKLANRMDGLLRKAMAHSGLPSELVENAVIEWRKVGFMSGVDHADRYGVPDHIKRFPRYHVRIEFRDKHGTMVDVAGPLCVGGGRFYGIGLFVAE